MEPTSTYWRVEKLGEKKVERLLRISVQRGLAKVENVNGEDRYSLTDKGLSQVEKLLRKREIAQIYFFEGLLYWLLKSGKSEDEAITLAIKEVEKYNPNFKETLKKYLEKVKAK